MTALLPAAILAAMFTFVLGWLCGVQANRAWEGVQ